MEIVGLEIFGVEPSSLDQKITGLTALQARKHWFDLPAFNRVAKTRKRRVSQTRTPQGPAIRSTELRRIPLNEIASHFIAKRDSLARANEMPGFREKIAEDAKRFGLVSEDYQLKSNETKKLGRPSLDIDEYLRVAETYVNAVRRREDPLQEIIKAEGHQMSKSNAGKMVFRARHEYGLLTATTKGKSGGKLTPKAIGLIAARNGRPADRSKTRKRKWQQ